MFKAIFGLWIIMSLISLSIGGAVIYLIYTIITKPELVHHWITVVTGG